MNNNAVESLNEQDVHVWVADPGSVADASALDALQGLLDLQEQARMQRFHFERDRRTFLVAHGLVRRVLSRYEDVAPDRWRFVTGGNGRPELHSSHGSPLRFNLSHTDGLVACGVVVGHDIGVDVETIDRQVDFAEIADRYLAPAEAAHLGSVPDEEQQGLFVAYWTLKEAYIKARGLGLEIPLDGFAFDVGGTITIAFDGIDDDPRSWQFFHQRPTDRHSLAVAVRRVVGDLNLSVFNHPALLSS